MSKALPYIAAAGTFLVTGSFQAAQAAFAITSMAVSLLDPPKKPGAAERQASVTTLSLGEQARELLIGETCTAGTLVDAFNFGGKYGTDTVTRCIAVADHAIDSVVGYYIGDQYYPWTVDGIQPGFSNKLSIRFYNATADGHAPQAHVLAAGWSASDRLAGMAVFWVDTQYDEKVWPQGHPQFKFVLRGLRAYDMRFDPTFGYTGPNPQTWEDRASHVHTRNAAILRYAFTRGIYAEGHQGDPDYLLIGRGLTPEEAPPERIIAAANLCDEVVDGAARYTANGVIRASDAFITVEEMFSAAMAGQIVQREGGVEVEPGQAKAAVVTITDGDLVVGEPVSYSAFLPDSDGGRINSVTPRYVSPAQNWRDFAGPVRRDVADIAADGGPREATLSLLLVTDGAQADRCAEIMRKAARLERRATIVLPPEYANLEEGDWIAWRSDRYHDGATVRFRIESWTLDEKWRMRLSLREIASSVFGVPDPVEAAAPPPPPPPVPVDALILDGVTAEAITLPGDTSAMPAVRFTWSTPVDAAVLAIRAEVRRAGETEIATGRADDISLGGMVMSNGVPADAAIEARLVPIGDPFRPVLASPWIPLSTTSLVAGDVSAASPTIADINARYDDLIDAYGDTVAAEASASAAAAAAAAAAADRAAADLALGGAEASELAAAGSASLASSKADEAAGSAEASSAAATAAQASNSASGGSAAASAASAATASAKATEAGTSAAAAQADRIGAQTANSNAGIARDGAVAAQSGAAGSQSAAAQSATLAARVGVGGGLYANLSPSFANGDYGAPALPNGWSDWASGWNFTSVSGQVSNRGLRYVVPAGTNTGLVANSNDPLAFKGAVGPGWWVMEAVVTLESGSLASSGCFLQATTLTGTGLNDFMLQFEGDPDSTGVTPGAGSPGKTYSFSKLVKVPNPATERLVFYAMPTWNGLGGTLPAKTIVFHFAGVRRATGAEVETGVARAGYASVSARLSAEEGVRASETAALAIRVAGTEASARSNPNLITNGSFEQNTRGWSAFSPWFWASNRLGTFAQIDTSGLPVGQDGYLVVDSPKQIFLAPNEQVTLSAEAFVGGFGPTPPPFTGIYCTIQWFNYSNGEFLTESASIGWNTPTAYGNFTRKSVTVAAPYPAVGTYVIGRVRFYAYGRVGGAIRRIKVEDGVQATAYNSDATTVDVSSRTSITETSVADAQIKLAVARLVLLAEATGGRPARFGLQSDSFGGSFASIDAAKIYFGDNTVFDDASDTLQTVTGSIRRVIAWGSTFGPDGLFEWVGDSSVALSAMTRANAQFFMASTSPYIGGAAITPAVETGFVLAGSASPLQTAVGATSVTVSAAVTGATGTVFYRWSQTGGDAATISNANIVNPTISVADNTGKVVQLQCQISDDQKTRTKYLRVFFRSNV